MVGKQAVKYFEMPLASSTRVDTKEIDALLIFSVGTLLPVTPLQDECAGSTLYRAL